MPERAAQLLRLSAAFQVARESDVRELAALARPRTLPRGALVFRQGEPASSLYVVETGLLRVSRLNASGRELTLMLGGPRQLVAGVSAFVQDATYSASCTALEDSQVLVLDAAAVRQLTCRSPALAEAVLTYFARRHADLLTRMEDLLFSDLNARLAAHLLDQTPCSDGYALPTNSELAALLGTVPELVSRKLGEFYRQRHITLHRRSVRILDEAALQRLAGR
ncbi:Crp/Fnr family transcriptional regulator [Deinococcus aquiradiocola]|uniref:CarD family transcriptional regulator n=1 Tax=Deinococcus aquiradiocola TaxID=393059 RepID=A0A917PFQ4_9DEIO|nr:Crp/Fnr family transcriptional regulator [Deinococcus aquiradiocola]GGJ75428.1 CarD family transcriptional regulator [Deinococcus aquiradiocola]